MVERTPPASPPEPRRNLARRDRTEDWDMRAATPPASPAEPLLPCPFCGSNKIDPAGWMNSLKETGPVCDDCGASGDSIRKWNRRATPPAPALCESGSDYSDPIPTAPLYPQAYAEGATPESDERARALLATPPAPAATDEEVARMVEILGWHREHPVTGKLVLTNPDGPAAADLLARVARERDDLERSWRMRGERCDEAETRATVAEARLAEVEKERDEAHEKRAHDMARQSTVIAFLRKRRGQLVIERDEARQRAEAAEKALREIVESPYLAYSEEVSTPIAILFSRARDHLAAMEAGDE